jgi:branched-subunit amino acid aminotransferase/4-amino-4-deoxychorismate lyase
MIRAANLISFWLDRVQSISACLSPWRKIHPASVPVEAKSCANYLNGYLARRDANLRGFDVGLMVGTDGFLAEGSIESLFVVKDDVLKTPPTGRILDSITRRSLLEAAPAIGIATSEDGLMDHFPFQGGDSLPSCQSGPPRTISCLGIVAHCH